ncbi:hypothetical protein L873DRAFT_1820411, partial [Choiromyces venosus 120613-1]
ALWASEGRFVIAGHRIRLSMVSGTMVIPLEENTGSVAIINKSRTMSFDPQKSLL